MSTGVLIDCDGVLVDSHAAAASAWNLWAKSWAPDFDFHRDIEHGRRITDLVAELISTSSDVAIATADLTQQELEHARRGCDTGCTPTPRVQPRRKLGGRHVRQPSDRHRPHGISGITRADILVASEDVENGKPLPDPYLLAAQRLDLPPQRCAVFEDAAGIASAWAAGVTTIIGVGARRRHPGYLCSRRPARRPLRRTPAANQAGAIMSSAASRLTIRLQEVFMGVPERMRRVVVSPDSIDVVESPIPRPCPARCWSTRW